MGSTNQFRTWAKNVTCPSCKQSTFDFVMLKDNIVEFTCWAENGNCEAAARNENSFSWKEKYKGDMVWNYKKMIGKNFVESAIDSILQNDCLHDDCCSFVPEINDTDNVVSLLEALIDKYKYFSRKK